LLKLLHIL